MLRTEGLHDLLGGQALPCDGACGHGLVQEVRPLLQGEAPLSPRFGEGREGDIELLEELGATIKQTAMCELGKTAPNPVLSTIKYFREEYDEHIEEGYCRAGVCRGLFAAVISEACIGCGACLRACPARAIAGEAKRLHVVDARACIGCGACFDKCPVNAIAAERPTGGAKR